MGRNIFQSKHAVKMADAIGKIVHRKFTAAEAWEYYREATATAGA
jgi:putative autoinducer-2 (AI-2) aldolase